ncbi:LysR family transcriptional regulator ArgP [Catellatospora sp. KI3]|uniref:LysR family transcriptional regulator ArgP n=1 Tax=Catellatospora sp. KI3 TaxID=3041620 RepID=UPI002482857C|nr:LysR family transcriptional regulator ArgP [Catellatospora sp. KI3]MDI1465937.1 LysR family transcriptional regulator ArgP [Catellatospora sp. KI3]
MDSAQLETFAAVVREGSFDAAARALNLTPSAVSQRIKALEQSAGQVLVRRAKPCQATEAGEPLLRLAGQLALLEREALDTARGGRDTGWTRAAIVVNADSLATWFLPALAALPPEPRLLFDVHSDDQEYTADLLRSGTVMAAVTSQHVPVQGCRVQRLGTMHYVAAAAPRTRAAWFAAGVTAQTLAAAPMLVLNRKDQLQHRFLRTVARRPLEPPIHYIPAVSAFNEAIRLGLGWGMVPERFCAEDLATGRLEPLLPGHRVSVPLYWQHWRLESAVLAALTEAVRAAAATALD